MKCIHFMNVLWFFFLPILIESLDFGYSGRDWYVGGDFNRARNSDGAFVDSANIGLYDGEDWESFGNNETTDGQVNAVFVDSCLNVYIGGSFTKVSGLLTGPLAIKRFGDDIFGPFNALSFYDEPHPTINSISVDCKNIPPVLTDCDCDVYIGGRFNLATSDYENDYQNVTAVNVARFDSFFDEKEHDSDTPILNPGWSALGGYASHLMVADDHEVYVVNKQNFGISISSNQLYVGGNFPGSFLVYDLSEKNLNKENEFDRPVDNMHGSVRDIYYDPLRYSINEVVIVGEMLFQVPDEPSKNCSFMCVFDRDSKEWAVFEGLERPLFRVDRNKGYFVVGGDRFLKRIEVEASEKEWVDFIDPKYDYLNVTTQGVVKDFYLCKSTDLGCSSDSIGLVTGEGKAYFYNRKKNDWRDFGLGIDGDAKALTSKFDYYK